MFEQPGPSVDSNLRPDTTMTRQMYHTRPILLCNSTLLRINSNSSLSFASLYILLADLLACPKKNCLDPCSLGK